MNLSAVNVLKPTANITTAGQPTAEDIATLKEKGYTTVIDLRGLSEDRGFDEKAVVEVNDLVYLQLPIAGGAGLTIENANSLHALLKGNAGELFVHCASGNRVGALIAISAFTNDHLSVDDALALGKAAGLTGFENDVKAMLTSLAS